MALANDCAEQRPVILHLFHPEYHLRGFIVLEQFLSLTSLARVMSLHHITSKGYKVTALIETAL